MVDRVLSLNKVKASFTNIFLIYLTCLLILSLASLQTHHVYSMLKPRENGRFHVASMCNAGGVFVGINFGKDKAKAIPSPRLKRGKLNTIYENIKNKYYLSYMVKCQVSNIYG